jgi:ribonuclease HII
MGVVIAGIDEAGYGPLLGPLCVGLSVFRVREVADPSKLPDLWKLLSRGVCRHPERAGAHDKRGRVAVADSKELKLANSVKTTHPLIHLERGVLTFCRCMGGRVCDSPADDAALLALLGASLAGHQCYAVSARALPLVLTPPEILIAANVLGAAMAVAGVELVALRCEIVDEPQYNQIIKDTGNKAETTAAAVGRHMRRVWEMCAQEEPETRIGIVCDRLGGRAQYSGLLERELDGCAVEAVEESDLKSRYAVTGKDVNGRERRAGVSFLVEGESAHLPIALASMVAKFVRELAMMRFNQHWGQVRRDMVGQDIKPTAGYHSDAQRWLDEIGEVMTAQDRRQLVRTL